MTANPLKSTGNGGGKPGCPLDMPRGDSDADKAARQMFWIQEGNRKLDAAGRHHLEWKAKDGHYWIEGR